MTPQGTGRHGGRLIVLEGPEGAGKTTQATKLAAALNAAGQPAIVLREPGATPLGERLRAIILDASLVIEAAAEALLFLAARAQLVPVIARHLVAGTTVVADRFMLSTYAYQIAGRGLDESLVIQANGLAVGHLVPDITLVLLVPPEAGLDRKRLAGGGRDRMEQAGVDFHQRVSGAFRLYATPEWQRKHPECGPIVAIDASGSEEKVGSLIWSAISQALSTASRSEVG